MMSLGKETIKIFDPVASISSVSNSHGSSQPINKHTVASRSTHVFNIINLLVIYWGNLVDVRKYKNKHPFLRKVKSVNTILKNMIKSEGKPESLTNFLGHAPSL